MGEDHTALYSSLRGTYAQANESISSGAAGLQGTPHEDD